MRIKSLDLARGFTVLCIPAVHSVLLYSQPAVRQTLFGQSLRFIAEGPGAQLFMTIMGISLTLSRNLSWSAILKRALYLALTGYALNLIKFVIPLRLHLLPPVLLQDLGWTDPDPRSNLFSALGLGDILQFAALSLPITYAVKQLRHYGYYALGLSVFVAFVAPAFWDHTSCSATAHYIQQLVGGQPPAIFFPLFPWLVYPLAGLAIGYFLPRGYDLFYAALALIGVILIGVGVTAARMDPLCASFYRTGPAGTALHVGIVCVALWVWEGVARYSKPNPLGRLCEYASRSITQIYFIQWPLIVWFVPLLGYQRLGLTGTEFACAGTSFVTLFLSLLITAARKEESEIPN